MIHLALVVAAVLFLGFVALLLLGGIIKGFESGWGCGCLAIICVLVLIAIVLFVALL
jgi:hypothetical protein